MARRPSKGKEAAANDAAEETTTIDVDAMLKQVKFNPEGLIGEVAEFLLQDLRVTRGLKPWEKMSEREQELIIERCEKQSSHIVRAVVEAMAARGLANMAGTIEDKGGFADGMFNLKLQVPCNAENLLLLQRRSGQVRIVFADAKEFEGAMKTTAAPDQPALIEGDAGGEGEGDEVEHDENGVIIEKPTQNTKQNGAAPGA